MEAITSELTKMQKEIIKSSIRLRISETIEKDTLNPSEYVSLKRVKNTK